jgi:structural maintenance of chromosome 1
VFQLALLEMGFLKRLELENFKSYKGFQVIGPFKRFTAIIGPNGAGKSNLMDAISFVLGEKTQHLRVRNLKDLIHGAPIGKPVASRAKVTAVYGEEEDEEGEGHEEDIHFTRIIVGSGTEYRINGKIVSPSDYQHKLETIGILIKAKNFLVFQGAVESIAMKTPKERTHLFEEISRSGELAKEYERKKEAMLKANELTNFSYHKRKGMTLEKKEARAEKEEAEKYQKFQQELAEAQVQEQLFKLYHNERDIEGLAEELRVKQKDLERLTSRRGKIEAQLKAKKQEAARWSREVGLLEKKAREQEVETSKRKPLYIKAKEKTSHVLKRLEASKRAHKKAQEEHKKHQKEVASLERELEETRERAAQFEEEMEEQSQGQDMQLLDSQVAEYNRLKTKAGKKAASLNQQLERVRLEQRTDEDALHSSEMKKQELMNKKQQLSEQRTEHEQRLEKLESIISTTSQRVAGQRREYEKLLEEVEQASLRYRELNDALETVQEKLRDARVDSQESSRKQKRAEILENLQRLHPGVYGTVIALCEPVHRRYQVAITKVLGRNIDAVVVDTEKTGKDCIQYIKEQHADPMTFIPLDTIEVKPINEALRQLGGNTKLVMDVIRYDPPQIKRALQFACGNAVVCETMEEARKVAFGRSERRRAVSLDGTLFQKSGVISGGAADIKAKAKRWDEKQVDALKRQRDRYLEELKEVTVVRRKEPELQNLKHQIDSLENRLSFSKKDREVTMEQSLSENSRELEVVEKELQELEPRLDNAQSSLQRRSSSVAKVQAKIHKLEDEVFRDFCRSIGVANIRQYEEKQLKGQQERARRRLEFANQVSRLQNQLAYEKQRDTSAHVKKFAASIQNDDSSIAALQEDERNRLREIEEFEAAIDELRERRMVLKKKIDDQDVETREIRKMLVAQTRDLTTAQKQITAMETELDQKKADRHSLLKTCKMEEIDIPMVRGSMDDIGDEEGASVGTSQSAETGSSTAMMDVDSMTSQGARMVYERESQIAINYAQLERRLKEVNSNLTEPTDISYSCACVINEVKGKQPQSHLEPSLAVED